MKKSFTTLAAAALVTLAGTAHADGVTDDKITIGMHSDLSGPLAIWGAPATNGARMRIEELNEAGGVHGRQIELIVEDTKYEVAQAVRATNKLVQRDGIFAMLMGLGTAQSLASMNILDANGIPNLFSLTAAKSMTEPFNPLHFNQFVTYQDQAAGALHHFNSEGAKKVCLQSAASDYGQEVDEGAIEAAEELGMEVVYKGSHKTTETDFAGVATAIKNTDCEVLVMGTTIRDSISLYATLRQLGWDKPVVTTMVAYTPLVAQAGEGKATEGLYISSPMLMADFESEDPAVQAFTNDYNEAFGEMPSIQAQMGYIAADLLVKGLENAGPDLTVESLISGIEAISTYNDIFGGPSLSFSAEKHSGGNALVLLQNQGGTWVPVVDELKH